MDISELIIQVKNTNDAVNEIKKVTNALNQTGKTAATVGKGLFATWSFTKVIKGAKLLGDAFKDVLVTFRNFDLIYGKMNNEANASVRTLTTSFQETERSAKKLLSIIGTRTFEFNFDTKTFTKMNSEIAKASEELAAFMQIDPKEVVDKLTRSLHGMTRGLAEYGIIVDQTSESFKKEVEELKSLSGYSEKAAKALVIWNNVNSQMKKFEGSAKNQQQTLSFAIENLTNTLKSGVFAKAGEILSKTFVPILNNINDILQNNWVQKIGAIVLALGGIAVTIKSVTVALASLKAIVFSMSAINVGTGLFASIGATIAGWPVALTTAIVGVLTLSGTMIISKVSSGEWLNISKLANSFYDKIKNVFERIVNFIEIGKFETHDDEMIQEISKKVNAVLNEYKTTFKELNRQFNSFMSTVDLTKLTFISPEIKNVITKNQERIRESEARLKKFKEKMDDTQQMIKLYEKELVKFQNAFEDMKKDVRERKTFFPKRTIKLESGKVFENLGMQNVKKTIENLKNAIESEKRNLGSYADNISELMKQQTNLQTSLQQQISNAIEENQRKAEQARKKIEEKRKQFEDYMKTISDTLDLKNWWESINQEFLRLKYRNAPNQKEILDSLKRKAKNITDFIQKVENEISKELALPKDKQDQEKIRELENYRLEKQKELVDVIKEQTSLKLNGLEKEYDIIKNTNDMIIDYARDAMRFKARGVSGIKVGTMEDYKFITSSLGNVSAINQALNSNTQMSIQLDQKRNDILNKANQELNGIRTEINKIISKNNTQIIAAI